MNDQIRQDYFLQERSSWLFKLAFALATAVFGIGLVLIAMNHSWPTAVVIVAVTLFTTWICRKLREHS